MSTRKKKQFMSVREAFRAYIPDYSGPCTPDLQPDDPSVDAEKCAEELVRGFAEGFSRRSSSAQ